MSTFSFQRSKEFGPLLKLPDTRYIGFSPENRYLYLASKRPDNFVWTNFSPVLDIHSIDEAIIGCTFLFCFSPYYKLFLSHVTSHQAIRQFFTACGCVIPDDSIGFHPETVSEATDGVPLFQLLNPSGFALLTFYSNVDGELFCQYGKKFLRTFPRNSDNCMVHCLLFITTLGVEIQRDGFKGPLELYTIFNKEIPYVQSMVGFFKQFSKYDR